MLPRHAHAPLLLLLFLVAGPLAAQTPAAACWGCAAVPQPLGFAVTGVEDGGRYLTLDDGSRWEVELSDRATAAAWVADDFVNLEWIAAPRGDYRYLLARVGDLEQRVAARLAGRGSGPGDSDD